MPWIGGARLFTNIPIDIHRLTTIRYGPRPSESWTQGAACRSGLYLVTRSETEAKGIYLARDVLALDLFAAPPELRPTQVGD
jgi:hypothetical protein